jgi:GDP-L-fucose synthase
MDSILGQKIYVAGHQGMVGSALMRQLLEKGYTNIVTRTHDELDLTNQVAVKSFFDIEKPTQVYLAAAKVGGIHANNVFPADFIYQNLMINANVIHQAYISGVLKLLCLGSSCLYPKETSQPMIESALLAGSLEPTNEPYAIAKIAGIKLCESYNRQYGATHGLDFRTLMPTNLYGPGDNYHPDNSHVIPGLIQRFHGAKLKGQREVVVWGTGSPSREFLYVDDMASAAIFVMNLKKNTYDQNVKPMQSHINVGFGSDISIIDLAKIVSEVVGFKGKIVCDRTKPDGAPRKLLDSSKIINLGWSPKISIEMGLRLAYADFLNIITKAL